MEKRPLTSGRLYMGMMAIMGWFALITQFYINLDSEVAPTSEIIIRYFSYFTIITNLLVTVCCTVIVLKKNTFWEKQTTLTALTVYSLIVGIIYNTMLRVLWSPHGIQLLVDELLHTVIPIAFFIYWIAYVQKDQLSRKAILPWMIYPSLYTIFILFRGSFSGFYPYSFINVAELGFQRVMVNAAGIAVAFIMVSLLFISFGNPGNYRGNY